MKLSLFAAISYFWAVCLAQTTTITVTVTVTASPTGTTSIPSVPTSTISGPTTITIIPTPTPTTPVYNTTVSYDTVYDNRAGSLSTVSCSDGSNGLLTKGFSTFGSLPSYPLIGGGLSITGWNSASCGTCWELAYTNAGVTTKVNVLAIDVALNSFNIALGGLNILTGGRGQQLGRVNVQARQVAQSLCGL